jgi:hypothetical protein
MRWFWFNPIEVLTSELLAGATIALPDEVNTILNLLRIGQQTMYGFFMAGLLFSGIMLVLTPLAVRARLWSLPLSIFSIATALCVNCGAIIATVLTVGAKYALTAQNELNIGVEVGVRMFVLMWLAALCSTVGFLLHAAMGCCCRIRKESVKNDFTAEGVMTNSSAVQVGTEHGAWRRKRREVEAPIREKNGRGHQEGLN